MEPTHRYSLSLTRHIHCTTRQQPSRHPTPLHQIAQFEEHNCDATNNIHSPQPLPRTAPHFKIHHTRRWTDKKNQYAGYGLCPTRSDQSMASLSRFHLHKGCYVLFNFGSIGVSGRTRQQRGHGYICLQRTRGEICHQADCRVDRMLVISICTGTVPEGHNTYGTILPTHSTDQEITCSSTVKKKYCTVRYHRNFSRNTE